MCTVCVPRRLTRTAGSKEPTHPVSSLGSPYEIHLNPPVTTQLVMQVRDTGWRGSYYVIWCLFFFSVDAHLVVMLSVWIGRDVRWLWTFSG